MDLIELFDRIEGVEFSASSNIAGTLSVFIAAIESTQEMKSLQDFINEDKIDTIKNILTRLRFLSELSPDPDFENPYDAAIAAYVWVLNRENKSLGMLAGSLALRARQTWWARDVSSLVTTKQKTEAGDTVGSELWNDMQELSLSQMSDSENNKRLIIDWLDMDITFSSTELAQFLVSPSTNDISRFSVEESTNVEAISTGTGPNNQEDK